MASGAMTAPVCPHCGRVLTFREAEELAACVDCDRLRAGPWKSGYGEYPFADEIYDLTHEPEPPDPYDDER